MKKCAAREVELGQFQVQGLRFLILLNFMENLIAAKVLDYLQPGTHTMPHLTIMYSQSCLHDGTAHEADSATEIQNEPRNHD